MYRICPPLWSSGQHSWLQIRSSGFDSPELPDFRRSSGSGTGSTQPRGYTRGVNGVIYVATHFVDIYHRVRLEKCGNYSLKFVFKNTHTHIQHLSTTKPNLLMGFMEAVTVHCENHTEHTNTLVSCALQTKFLYSFKRKFRAHSALPT
jgi:hypothetical protein